VCLQNKELDVRNDRLCYTMGDHNNRHNNVYGAVNMAQSLQEFTRFI